MAMELLRVLFSQTHELPRQVRRDLDSILHSEFDYDFTRSSRNDQRTFYRGGMPYNPPYGWVRYGLKVRGKYTNDLWLEGDEFSSNDGWPVSYYGASWNNWKTIAQNGYNHDLKQGKKGICTSPSINIAAESAETIVDPTSSKRFVLVFQNRVSKKDLEIVTCRSDESEKEYWIQPHEDLVRPYGICLRVISDTCTIQ